MIEAIANPHLKWGWDSALMITRATQVMDRRIRWK